MSPETPTDSHLEIAHVLLIDIVAYSKLLIDQQTELIRDLNEKVRNTEEFRTAEAAGKLIRIATGEIREWTTVDWILNYTFNFPALAAQNEVAGYAKDGGKSVKMKEGKDKIVMPVSTAEYNPFGWRAWLNNTTITIGMNNIFDAAAPFVAGGAENGYDEQTTNIKGRIWYVALKKRF